MLNVSIKLENFVNKSLWENIVKNWQRRGNKTKSAVLSKYWRDFDHLRTERLWARKFYGEQNICKN